MTTVVEDLVPEIVVEVSDIALKGDPGEQGIQGIAGPAVTLTVGSVTEVAPGLASASITGTSPDLFLNLELPVGITEEDFTTALDSLTALVNGKATPSDIATAITALSLGTASQHDTSYFARPSDVTNAVASEATARTNAISSAIGNLVNSAPGLLDTLGEIATRITDDETGVAAILATVTAVQTALTTKAPLASPALTGTPTAPTTATSDNSTKLATTAFVKAVVSALSGDYAAVTEPIGAAAATAAAAAQSTANAAVTVIEAPLSPARYGAVGDGTTDDTTALQAAIAAASRATNGEVRLSKAHKLTDALTITSTVRISGANGTPTVLTQATANKAIFKLVKDTGGGESFSRGAVLSDMMLVGPGSGATTAFGIDGDNSGDATYQGQRLLLDNLRVKGFATGIQLNHWDNCEVRAVTLESCTVGWYSRGNANSMRLQLASTTCATAIKLGDGMGVILDLMDNIAAGQMLTLASGAEAKLLGGNFEDCTGAQAFVYIPSGAQLTVLGGRFVKTVGNDVNRFLLDNGGILTIAGVPHDDTSFTTKAIKTGNQPDGLTVLGNGFSGAQPPVAAAELFVDHNGAMTYPAETVPAREDDFAPANPATSSGNPDLRLRGRLLRLLGRDSANTQDRLLWFSQDKSSGTAQILRHRLDGRLYGTGSPNGVIAAPVGTEYIDEAGTANLILYVKESGTGNTGWTAYGQGATGVAGPAGTTGRRDLALQKAGFITENWPADHIANGQAPVSGTVYGMLLALQAGDVVSKLCVAVAAVGVGTTPTQIKLGLLRVSTGKIVALTANEASNAAWTATANTLVGINLTGPYTVPADDGYVLCFQQVGAWGTTQLTLGRPVNVLLGSGLSAAFGSGARRLGLYSGSTTDLPAVGSAFSGSSNTNFNYWAGAA